MDNFEANRMTRNHQDDARLIAALDAALVQSPASPVIGDDLMKPIIEAMESHPKFRNELTRCFGSKWLSLKPQAQAHNLLIIAVERGPSAAVAWCHKVYSTERADLRYVSLVYGLHIEQPRKLSNGVSLMPLAKLPPSASAEAVQLQFQSSWPDITTPQPIGATFEVREDVCPEESSFDVLRQRSDEIERTVRAFTLVEDADPVIASLGAAPMIGAPRGCAPMIGMSWIDFVDTELTIAESGRRMSYNFANEGALDIHSRVVDTDAIEWVERYIGLAPELRSKCDIAIERLNLARRRHSPGNKAIEGAICLEALLGNPDDKQEITYKLALRSALLLSTEFDERCKISGEVRKFYTLRSNTVHGNSGKSKPGDATCAARGLDICARVLRKIVSLNKTFVPRDWELSGGEPQSPLKK
jgi:hypothetical protein